MNYKFETIECNLCGSKDYEIISNKGKFDLPTRVVLCKNCGLAYLNPRWDRESYLNFYKNDYDKYYRPAIHSKKISVSEKENPIIVRLRQYNLLTEKTNTILDIGSGEGQNLMDLKSNLPNSTLFAIEPSAISQEHLITNKIVVISKDIDSDWDKNYIKKFDLIIMRHVLEHFMDPIQVMKKVKNVLSISGIAYIAVPNNLKPSQSLEKSWFRNVHTYYFNKYSLKNLMKISGFEVMELVEGDEFNRSEVYLIVKASTTKVQPTFSNIHFQKQEEVYKKKLIKDKNTINKGILYSKKGLLKLLSLIKK